MDVPVLIWTPPNGDCGKALGARVKSGADGRRGSEVGRVREEDRDARKG